MSASRAVARASLAILSLAAALVAAEAALRVLDDQPLTALALLPVTAEDRSWRAALRHVAALPVESGVDRAWFESGPPVPEAPAGDPELAGRVDTYARLGLPSWYEWNRQNLAEFACGRRADFDQVYAGHTDFFTFDPPRLTPFPAFRFLRRAVYPSGLITNEYGWRGPGVALDKPPRTVRIGFVGASTTVGFHAVPVSYPEYVGHWLNIWASATGQNVRFEVLNAAREGIDSHSIAEVVRQELLPLEPDLVVYYEGANQFWPSAFVRWENGTPPERPRLDPRTIWAVERYSVIGGRLREAWQRLAGRREEDERPDLVVEWPADLDEFDPPLDDPRLPLNLPAILADFEAMRAALEAEGAELALSTFFWMAFDGMRLDPIRNGNVLHYLHRVFWPFGHGHIERMAAFQNRVFAKFAAEKRLPLLDFAAMYPRDADLFADAIHMTPAGGAPLQAWVTLQLLVPVIEARLDDGRLPRPDRQPLASHPSFGSDMRRLEPIDAILSTCDR